MTESTLLIHVDEAGTARVTLNRPEMHNALDEFLISQLTFQLKDLAEHPGVRAIVLAARGASFCAGADLGYMRRMADYSKEKNYHDAMALAELLHTLDNLPKPTIAQVHGPAFGGGVGLVACCDLAIAAESATFRLSEVRLGLVPGMISPYVVAAIGPRPARALALSGRAIDAAEARRLGLVTETAPGNTLDARTGALLQDLRENGPEAMAATKVLLSELDRRREGEGVQELTARAIASNRSGAEAREGLEAFLNKRRPRWRT